MTSATLRAAAAIVATAADRTGRAHWHRIAAHLDDLADENRPAPPPTEEEEMTYPHDELHRLAEALDAAPEPERRQRLTPQEIAAAETDTAEELTRRAALTTKKENR